MKFSKQFFINSSSILLGVLGILISIYFYIKSIKEYEPVLFIKNNSEILNYNSIASSQIKVVRKDNTEVNNSIFLLQFILLAR